LEKPRAIVAGTDRFTDEELFDLSDSLRPIFNVETRRQEEFVADKLIPLIILIFTPVTYGFLAFIHRPKRVCMCRGKNFMHASCRFNL